jgi:hypothetical protein
VSVVREVKADLERRGMSLSGPCGAFEITKRVAWQLRAEGAGVLTKPDGENCQGFAKDIVAYPDGRIFDMLIDGGGTNGPAWQDKGTVSPERYRRATDPGDGGSPPPVDDQWIASLDRISEGLAGCKAGVDALRDYLIERR